MKAPAVIRLQPANASDETHLVDATM